ncbi:hypothetical protein ABIE67_009644 [Streptomyces sp. V4I8]|uniref:IS3 family transposase n=1 Tax=Streptomyces sp. V4I8 TaxID=3156469 RepID=UPI0035113591
MSDRFEFIDAEYAPSTTNEEIPPVAKMCDWLEVSRSGFYERRSRPISATARRREDLKLLMTKSFEDSDSTYGYRRIHADLTAWGVPCGPELVRDLMRELDLQACQPRPWRHSLTENDGRAGPIPDLVNRDFTAEALGRKMVGSGSRRESHPPAPTEPCVTVSRYTALVTPITRNYGTSANARTFPGTAV